MPIQLTVKQQHRLEDFLAREASLLQRLKNQGSGSLKFNQPCVSASTLGAQYYCELKVEMEHIHGRVKTEVKSQGSEGHDALQAGSVEENRETILGRIFGGERVIVHEMPILADYKGVVLAGQPDAIIFNDGVPLTILEYKFSSSPYPYRSYHAQARVYCRILDSAGFDTSDLFYVIAVASRESRGDENLFRRVIKAVNESGMGEMSLKINGAHVYLHEYNQPEADGDIDWALEYWKEKRQAMPSENQAKCRGCEYREKCQSTNQ